MNTELYARYLAALKLCPLITILRGLKPNDAIGVVESLYDAGIRIVEVPLNSPQPCESIRLLTQHFPDDLIIGGGTVLSADQVDQVADAGGKIIVSLNCDPSVIERSRERGLISLPGVATATEAFKALSFGASGLKVFPAGGNGFDWVKAMKAVLPASVQLFGVGGVSAKNCQMYLDAGYDGVGIGSDVYTPGLSAKAVAEKINKIMTALTNDGTPQPVSLLGIAAAKSMIGESPLWMPELQQVAWVDPVASVLYTHSLGSHKLQAQPLDRPVSSIMLNRNNQLLGVSNNYLLEITPANGSSDIVAEVPLGFPDCRLNDAAIDPTGRVWCGSMSYALFAGHGELFCVEPDGEVRKLRTGLGVPNGLGWSPDYKQFYLVDTLYRTLIAFDCDIASGEISNPRVLTDFMGIPGKPDGLCVGADGAIWVAMWGGGLLVRVTPEGIVTQKIVLPTPNVSSCCFADNDQIIYVSTSRLRLSRTGIEESPLSGSLLVVDLNQVQARSL